MALSPNVSQALLNEVNGQLNQKGLLIKHGSVSIIDASVIEAQRSRPNKDKDGNCTQDPDAAWNVKTAANGKKTSTYGYKAHVNFDEDGFIKATDFTAGNVHDSQVFTSLLNDKDAAMYADSAYSSQAHTKWLKQRHIEECMRGWVNLKWVMLAFDTDTSHAQGRSGSAIAPHQCFEFDTA
jgi:transposase, IS5 family